MDRGKLVMVGVVLDQPTPDSFATFETACGKLPFMLSWISLPLFAKSNIKPLFF